jgi:asparagine synthase (glutamine-hydrolysing)
MCGIVGGISSKFADEGLQKNMLRCLMHRGPDDEGSFFDDKNNIFLGQTRLSIIDLSPTGHQPMRYEHGGQTFWITFNGEIYNYKELKKELAGLGHNFKTDSDTEVILAGYAQWGMDVVNKLRGMFAFALWDKAKNELTLCRDRFGVKPLFVYRNGGEVVFCSEINALKAWSGFSKAINQRSLALFLQLGFITGSETIFKGVTRVSPGSYLVLNARGETVRQETYWSAKDYVGVPVQQCSRAEALEKLEAVLTESFNYRLVADVPVGVFLSGGIDSSLVAALLQKDRKEKLKTFTIGFKEKGYDEAPYAKKIAEHLGTDHTELYISQEDVLKEVQNFGELFDEPFGDASGLPTLLLSRLARQQVKVALSGDGGDELFGGYAKYATLLQMARYPRFVRQAVASLAQVFGATVVEKLLKTTNTREKLSKLAAASEGKDFAQMYVGASSYWQTDEVAALFGVSSVAALKLKIDTKSRARQLQLWDIENYLANDILVKSDRTTMRAGLEGREPFLDAEIWRTVNELPQNIMLDGFGSKKVLKEILAKYVPAQLWERPKAGFRPPMHEWLAGPLKPMLYELLSAENIKKQGLFNPAEVSRIVAQHQSGTYVNPDKLWLLMTFSLWHRAWF